MTDPAPSSLDLTVIAAAQPLPVPLQPPVRCAALADRLHVVGRDPGGDGFLRVVLDAAGQPVGDVVSLPVRVAALAASMDGLVATGSRPEGGGPPLVFAVDAGGSILWQHELAVVEPLSAFPVPVSLSAEGFVALVWVTGTEQPTLHVAALAGETPRPIAATPLDGVTVDLDIDGSAGAVTIARVSGYPLRLEVVRAGEPPERRPLPGTERPNTATVAAGGGRTFVAWTSIGDASVRVQALGDDLAPAGSPAVAAEVAPPAALRDVRFIRGDSGRLALRYRTGDRTSAAASRREPGSPTARREPVAVVEQFVAPFDPRTGSTGPVRRIEESGHGFDAAAWVGDRLLVCHGSREPLFTILEQRTGAASGTG
jgi:hypothetical protein